MGFDFAGMYTKIEDQNMIAYEFGDRKAEITFIQELDGVLVRVTFEPETQHPIAMQRDSWQAILNNFSRHTETL